MTLFKTKLVCRRLVLTFGIQFEGNFITQNLFKIVAKKMYGCYAKKSRIPMKSILVVLTQFSYPTITRRLGAFLA